MPLHLGKNDFDHDRNPKPEKVLVDSEIEYFIYPDTGDSQLLTGIDLSAMKALETRFLVGNLQIHGGIAESEAKIRVDNHTFASNPTMYERFRRDPNVLVREEVNKRENNTPNEDTDEDTPNLDADESGLDRKDNLDEEVQASELHDEGVQGRYKPNQVLAKPLIIIAREKDSEKIVGFIETAGNVSGKNKFERFLKKLFFNKNYNKIDQWLADPDLEEEKQLKILINLGRIATGHRRSWFRKYTTFYSFPDIDPPMYRGLLKYLGFEPKEEPDSKTLKTRVFREQVLANNILNRLIELGNSEEPLQELSSYLND